MIGIILKNVRVSKGLSQKELGDLLALADNTISSYERGNSQPDFETIIRILEICDYKLQLVNKNENMVFDLDKFSREI